MLVFVARHHAKGGDTGTVSSYAQGDLAPLSGVAGTSPCNLPFCMGHAHACRVTVALVATIQME